MSAQTSALTPARDSTFTRRTPVPARLAIAAIAVAGIVALGAAAVAVSRSSAAPLAATGGFGHVAPMTSAYDRAFGTAAVGSSTLIVTSPATGRSAHVPADAAPAVGSSTLIVTSPATGRTAHVPADATAMGQATASPSSTTTSATRTLVLTDTNGFARRLPLP